MMKFKLPFLISMPRMVGLLVWMMLSCSAIGWAVYAQELGDTPTPDQPIADAADIASIMNPPVAPANPERDRPSGIDLLSLITRGGWLMIPIGLMSMLVVTLAIERALSLRRSKIMPRRLVERLAELMRREDHFDPTEALAACKKYPSPTATVVGAMLLRTGQPLGEVEHAASETIQREVDRFASPVRWLTLAAAATPLMGLLGTVWGMIVAFHESTTLSADRSRSEQLSEGIYTALVTTLAGLVVAIPAAILAQYLENRIAKLFHRVEELAFGVAPGLVRFVGRSRLDQDGRLKPMEAMVSRGDAHHPLGVPTPPPIVEKARVG